MMKTISLAFILCFFVCMHVGYTQSYVRSTTNNGVETYWSNPCILLYLHEVPSKRLAISQIQQELVQSLQVWNDPTCSDLTLSYQGLTADGDIGYDVENIEDNQNMVRFRSQANDWLYDPLALALTTLTICQSDNSFCRAGEIIDADIEINEAYFTVTTSDESPVVIDLLNTLSHEIGHFIGFDHNFVAQSTMFPAAPPGEIIKRDLSEIDIQGLCDVYDSNDACVNDTDESTGTLDDLEEGCEQHTTNQTFLMWWLSLVLLLIFRGLPKALQQKPDPNLH